MTCWGAGSDIPPRIADTGLEPVGGSALSADISETSCRVTVVDATLGSGTIGKGHGLGRAETP